MSAAITRYFFLGDLGTRLSDSKLQIVQLRFVHPLLHVGGLRYFQLEFFAEGGEVARRYIDQLLQGTAFDFQIVLRSDLLRAGQVITRLRLKSVGDGGSAYLEIALGLCVLFGNSGLLRIN